MSNSHWNKLVAEYSKRGYFVCWSSSRKGWIFSRPTIYRITLPNGFICAYQPNATYYSKLRFLDVETMIFEYRRLVASGIANLKKSGHRVSF
jgi:hypothetical protein